MARASERLAANAGGPFYVDASCIDCGTCWQFDPAHFAPTGSSSHVWAQPQGDAGTRAALLFGMRFNAETAVRHGLALKVADDPVAAAEAFEEVLEGARGNLFTHEFFAAIGAAWGWHKGQCRKLSPREIERIIQEELRHVHSH